MSNKQQATCNKLPKQLASSGFTLIEMLVSIGIAGTLAAALIVSLLIGRETYLSSSASIDVQQEARRAFQTMVSELREGGADSTNATHAPPQPITIMVGTITTPNDRIDFQIARSYNNGIVWGGEANTGNDNDWLHYYASGAQLLRCRTNSTEVANTVNLGASATCTASRRVLANNLSTFQAAYDNANRNVMLTLNIRETSNQLPGGSMSTNDLKTTVKLRNP